MSAERSVASAAAWPAGAQLAALIPHQGRMCLLDRVLSCTPGRIDCLAVGHRAADHPLRGPLGLLSVAGIEYAAQAMALHGALVGRPGVRGRPGFLASARAVRLHVPRLDDVAGALRVQAEHVAGDGRQAMYRFALSDDAGRALVDGRVTLVLDTPVEARR